MKVRLISYTNNPLRSICTAVNAMHERDPFGFTDVMCQEEKETMLNEMLKTRLRGALEFASFEFCIEGVTRAFTHQLVRHRKMHFSQQSMRFFNASESGFRMPSLDKHKDGEIYKSAIQRCVNTIRNEYTTLVNNGCPKEDARSILPTNIETLITFGATYRDILEMAEVRLCYQTQAEFKEVMRQIKSEIAKVEPFLASKLLIVCQRTGECEFKSIYDRECPIEKTLPKIKEKLNEEKTNSSN